MADRVTDLETRVVELARALADVRARVEALEHGLGRSGARRAAQAATASAAAAASAADVPSTASAFAFAGRTLLVLAGAFVLRALTDSGTLAAPLGVGLGLVYAGTWIALADRAGKAGASWSAGFQ